MKINITTIILLILLQGCTGTKYYTKIGVGLKDEIKIKYNDGGDNRDLEDKISARIEVGAEYGNIIYGVSHSSQWLTGFPFDNSQEYSKTEIFVDYKFKLN